MRRHQWLASGCVIALAAGLTACGGSSSGSSGGGGSSTSAASSSLVVETAFVLKTLHPARMFEPPPGWQRRPPLADTRPGILHFCYDCKLLVRRR